jgi:hypothetical protein
MNKELFPYDADQRPIFPEMCVLPYQNARPGLRGETEGFEKQFKASKTLSRRVESSRFGAENNRRLSPAIRIESRALD